MFLYNLTSHPTFDVDNKILDSVFKIMSSSVSKEQTGTVNIVFVDSDSIQKLNNNYRQKNIPTDVLSFHYYEDFGGFSDDEVVGEIILSETHIIKQGKEYQLGSHGEFYKLVIHSLLHILGYDHEIDDDYKQMQALEDEIWEKVFGK